MDPTGRILTFLISICRARVEYQQKQKINHLAGTRHVSAVLQRSSLIKLARSVFYFSSRLGIFPLNEF